MEWAGGEPPVPRKDRRCGRSFAPPGVMKRIVWTFCQEPLKYKPPPKADVHFV